MSSTTTLPDLLGETSSTLMSSVTSGVYEFAATSMTSTTSMDAAASSAYVSSVLSSASSVLAEASRASSSAAAVIATATGGTAPVVHPASYKIIGIVLAIVSGLFIGSSFVFKKKGLISMQNKPGFVAGEGHAYLKSPMWWTGMTLMIVGEICNFVAYAFTEAILVTPMGALSVVICAVLSSIFLKERLTFFGKIGCVLCVVGAVVIALNGPSNQAAATIPEFQKLFLSPGFLAYGSVVIVVSLGMIFWAGPRYGKKNMLVYIVICSLIGGLSVVCTSGLGSSILTSINGNNQFKHWFIYFLLGFVVVTLLTEINYLNKALELFNTAMVTPTYYVIFTFATLVTDVILNKGFDAPPTQIVSVVFGFFTICCGITLLQMSKIDPEDLANKVSLDRRSTMLLKVADDAEHAGSDNEKGDRNLDLEDPGVDTIRGLAGLVGSVHRAVSARRTITRRKSQMSSRMSQRDSRGGGGGAYEIDEEGQIIVKEGRWRNRHLPQLAMNGRPGMQSAHSERGADGIMRHQLYDAPMPSDAAERISHYSRSDAGGPPTPTSATHGHPMKVRSPTIGFEEEVVEHRYPRRGESGEIVHQLHPQHHTYPHGLQHTLSEISELGERSNSSILDAYSPANTLPTPTTPRPRPAHRASANNSSSGYSGYPVRSGSTSTHASSGTSGSGGGLSTATGGSVVRGENRSLSRMITNHFAGDDGTSNSSRSRNGLAINTGTGNSQDMDRHTSASRSPTSRSFFSSIRGHGKNHVSEEEEKASLVGHGADFAGSYQEHLAHHGARPSEDDDKMSFDDEQVEDLDEKPDPVPQRRRL